jgi:hypothetical protein
MIGLRPVGAKVHHKLRNCVLGGLPIGVCRLHSSMTAAGVLALTL